MRREGGAGDAAPRHSQAGVVIAAAGRGDRAGPGPPKQYRAIAGVPMLLRAIRPFAEHPAIHQIVVVLPADAVSAPPSWLAGVLGDRLRVTPGGAARAESVLAGLRSLDPSCDVVLVHDAARPFVSRETVDAVLAVAESGSGAVPGLPVADTLKRVQADRTVSGTLARENLWRASTPQGFPRAVLERAFAAAGEEIAHYTDEAALVEALGQTVTMVPDTATNLKITTPEDFELAEALARL